MKFFILGIFIIITVAVISDANADDPHGVVIQQGNPSTSYQDFTAAAVAIAQIHPELGTQGWQVGGGIGFANNEQAIAIGGHKRFNKTLWGGTIATQNGELIGGFGFNLKFP